MHYYRSILSSNVLNCFIREIRHILASGMHGAQRSQTKCISIQRQSDVLLAF